MTKIDPDLKRIVMARVQTYDSDFELIIGGNEPMDKESLLRNIEEETDVGKKIVSIQLKYMQDLISGKIYKALG